MNGPAQHGHDGERKRQNDKGDFSGVHFGVSKREPEDPAENHDPLTACRP